MSEASILSSLSAILNKRFTDNTKEYEGTGFIKRNLLPNFWQVTAIYVLVITVLAIIINNTEAFGGNVISTVIAGIVVLALGGFFLYSLQRIYDMLTANEFQNALFAGGAGAGTEFAIIVNGDNSVVYANPGYFKYFPRHPSDSSDDLKTILSGNKLAGDAINRITDAISQDRRERIDAEIADRLGNMRKLALVIEPIRRPKGFFLIKALKRDPEELMMDAEHESLRKILSSLSDALPFAFYIADKDNKISFVNNIFAESFSYYQDELEDKDIKIEDLIFNLDKTACDLDKNWEGDLTFFDKNNQIFKATIKHYVIKDKQNTVVRKFGIIQEFSTKSLTVADLNEGSENFLDAAWGFLSEHSPIALALIDRAGVVQRNNRAFRNMVRSLDLQSTGINIIDVFAADNKDEISELLNESIEKGQASTPVSAILSGNSSVTASLYISPLAKVEGKIPGYLCNLIDTTEQKNLEQRFVHSQKMQAVGQLAGGIAHDFNNLLTAMTGFCDLLLIKHPSGDPSFADIMQIKQNANRAANLVRKLLAFSRKQTLHPEVINIADILAELSSLIRRLIGENIELKLKHGRNLWPVKLDQGQFEQVVINLAVNARDAMEDGGSLTIETKNVKITSRNDLSPELIPPAEDEVITPGEYVAITITDNGYGIENEIISKIFEPFFSTKEIGQGTGLGLSTVYGIVKQTDGYIYVSSEVGRGTIFSLFFKRDASEVKAGKDKEDKKEADRSPADLTGAETILLVEDEDPVRVFGARALRNKGYSVLEADCGEAALDIISKKGDDISVIVTDVVMPGINGPTMIEEVLKKHPHIKVIFISGYAEDAFVKTYGTDRKFNFLPKPFTLKQLAGKVKEVIDKK